MANTYIYRTLGTPTSTSKGTVSHWIKRGAVGVNEGSYGTFGVFNNGGAAADRGHLNIYNDTIYFYNEQTSTVIQTNKKLRDVNGWYHIVIAWDTTQATASNRVKIYVNGEQETSFSTANYPGQNNTMEFNVSGRRFALGALGSNGNAAYFWDGSISHFHFCDGYTYAASDFGSTDSTTGEWEINTAPSVTYGNNGFFILKDGNSLTDQSGNSNNFTLGGGTLTKTEDCPSNVFATFNPLANPNGNFTNGNNTINTSSPGRGLSISTLGMSSGKYYCEFKSTTNLNSDGYGIIADPNPTATDQELGHTQYGYAYYSFNGYIRNNDGYTVTSGFNTFGQNDIIGVAVDLDNNKLYFSKNGTWQNSGDPTSGSTGTGAISITAASSTSSGFYHFACSDFSSNTAEYQVNFGNGYFGTTAVSSAGTNASGNGIFEYDVPTGYTALSTKGLNL